MKTTPMPTESALPPWAVRLLSEIDAADERAAVLAKPLTVDQLNWKPSPGEPFVAIIFFTVGTGLEILVRHQRRHLLQAERVAARRV